MRQCRGIALGHHIQLAWRSVQQQVAHRATNEICPGGCHREQPLAAGLSS